MTVHGYQGSYYGVIETRNAKTGHLYHALVYHAQSTRSAFSVADEKAQQLVDALLENPYTSTITEFAALHNIPLTKEP